MSKIYEMPAIEAGESVLVWNDGDVSGPPFVGLVSQVNGRTLCASVFDKDSYSLSPRDGLRHVSDPDVGRIDLTGSGVWDYSEQSKKVRVLERAVRGLLEKVK